MLCYLKKFPFIIKNRVLSSSNVDRYVRDLRRHTGAPYSLCLEAYNESIFGLDESIEYINTKMINSNAGEYKARYFHHKGLIGLASLPNISFLIRIDCETYSNAESDDMYELVGNGLNYLVTNLSDNESLTFQEYQINQKDMLKLRLNNITFTEIMGRYTETMKEQISIQNIVAYATPSDIVTGVHALSDRSNNSLSLPFRNMMGNIGSLVFIKSTGSSQDTKNMNTLSDSLALHCCGMIPVYLQGRPKLEFDCDSFLKQPFLRDSEFSVETLLEAENVEIVDFYREECIS